MREVYCDPQYSGYCVEIEPGDTVDDIIEYAREIDAIYPEKIDDDESEMCFVVQFPGGHPELYSEKALRNSFKSVTV